MARMRKVVLYVLDLNNPMSEQDLANEIVNNLEFAQIGSIKTVDIGEWHDDHELNKRGADHEKYFK